MIAHPYCIALVVNEAALDSLLQDGELGGYRDPEPWWIAVDMLASAEATGATLYALLASGNPLSIMRWARIDAIEVHEYASSRETRIRFAATGEMNPIFQELDSITLRPPQHQLEREQREGLRQRRIHLDESWLHSYAVCETPTCLPPPADNGDATAAP